ncbi:MAG: copper amine oxidase N-terminal domain-containing protein [Oscillospiraceae bacterium]|nr:copper amine oxidase N-terminal domain-containing protein [Oscillospiraceae bacterium]
MKHCVWIEKKSVRKSVIVVLIAVMFVFCIPGASLGMGASNALTLEAEVYFKYLAQQGYEMHSSGIYKQQLPENNDDSNYYDYTMPNNSILKKGIVATKLADFDGDGKRKMFVVLSDTETYYDQNWGNIETFNLSLVMLTNTNGVVSEAGKSKIIVDLHPGFQRGYVDLFVIKSNGRYVIGIESFEASTIWSDGMSLTFLVYEYINGTFNNIIIERIFGEDLWAYDEDELNNILNDIVNRIRLTGIELMLDDESVFGLSRVIDINKQVENLFSIDYNLTYMHDDDFNIINPEIVMDLLIYNDVESTDGVPGAAPVSEIIVLIDGVALSFDQPPIIENGRTLVPLRAIFEALGAQVGWQPLTETVTAVKDDITIIMRIGDDYFLKNGVRIQLDVPAKIVNGRTLVPARAVAEGLGADVGWIDSTQTVTIKTGT